MKFAYVASLVFVKPQKANPCSCSTEKTKHALTMKKLHIAMKAMGGRGGGFGDVFFLVDVHIVANKKSRRQ